MSYFCASILYSLKEIIFIAILYPNRSPSQRFRYEQYIPFLESQGYQCTLKWIINKEDEHAFYKGNLLAKLWVFLKATLRLIHICYSVKKPFKIFIQREVYFLGTPLFAKWLSKKASIIYDFDDSIWLPNISESNRYLAFLKSTNKTKKIISFSKQVIAGNDFLAEYAQQFNQNVTVIPTCVDTQKFKPNDTHKISSKVTIGWTGSHTTIPHFKEIIPVLHILKEKYQDRLDFIVIGDPNFEYKPLGIQGQAWRASHEVEDLYPIDIGIMPLPDDPWSQGKCGFKAIQYMALSIPTVMSPVGVNPKVANYGKAAYLASDSSEWVSILSELIENPQLRQQFGTIARQHIVANYSLDANAPLFLKVISDTKL